MEGLLALEDGRVFRGRSFGAVAERGGEVVFNTSMTGYQEVLTDPSYCGQIVVMTTPHVGDCGVNDQDVESCRVQVEGFVVREHSEISSSWRARKDLAQYLRENDIPAVSELDTRALTHHLRSGGVLRGVILTLDPSAESKESILRRLTRSGCRVTIVPARTTAEAEIIHVNLNDGSVEGLRHRTLPAFSVQYHPEASPGPHDTHYLFDEFTRLMDIWKEGTGESRLRTLVGRGATPERLGGADRGEP